MRIDGVSEETDADGTVTSHFEYFRQREEMYDGRSFSMTMAEDLHAEDRQLKTETARYPDPRAVYRDPTCD